MAERNPHVRNAMKRSKSGVSKWVFGVLLFVVVAGALLLQNWPSFGGKISGERLQKAEASVHYEDGRFTNVLTHPPLGFGDVWNYVVEQFFGDQSRVPPFATPIAPIPFEVFEAQPTHGLRAIWLGHSSVYLELGGFRLMIDPVFSEYASPFPGIGPRRFHPPPISLSDLPNIDAVVISHDHYDHLDMPTIQHLSSKGSRFFVPLGVGAHLQEWGVLESRIVELDWWESAQLGSLTMTCTLGGSTAT